MKITRFIAAAFIALFFASCTNAPDETMNLDKYTDVPETISYQEYLNSIGSSWLTPEKDFSFDSNYDSIAGIQKLNPGNLGMSLTYQDRIYFMTVGEQGTLYAYLDSTTGEVFDLCPDPLCSHTDRDKCPYVTVFFVVPDNSTEDGKLYLSHEIIYEEGQLPYMVISELTEDGTLRRVYGERNQKTEEGYSVRNTMEQFCVYHNFICFTENYDYRSNSEVVETKSFFRVVNGDTGELVFTCDRDEIEGTLLHITDSNLLFQDSTRQNYYITDLKMQNPKTVLTKVNSASITYDFNTEEYFVYTTELDDAGNTVSKLCVYDKNWNGYPLEMPSSQITYAVITQNYIYYEKYHEPVVYGTSIRDNMQTTDTTGNKIFRVKRIHGEKTTVSEEELVFDGHGEIFHSGFNVVGENLYLKFKELHREGEYVWWRLTGDMARINIAKDTIHWFNLQ